MQLKSIMLRISFFNLMRKFHAICFFLTIQEFHEYGTYVNVCMNNICSLISEAQYRPQKQLY